MHSVSGEQYKLSVREGKHSVGEVKLSVELTGCHSGTTEITIAWLKLLCHFCCVYVSGPYHMGWDRVGWDGVGWGGMGVGLLDFLSPPQKSHQYECEDQWRYAQE